MTVLDKSVAVGDLAVGGGFDVFEAKDGETGLQIALEEHPDLILLDIIMPVMDGMTMLRKLRGDKWGRQVPVLVLTNLSSAETSSAAFQEGVGNYLVKTEWTIDEVLTKVREELEELDVPSHSD